MQCEKRVCYISFNIKHAEQFDYDKFLDLFYNNLSFFCVGFGVKTFIEGLMNQNNSFLIWGFLLTIICSSYLVSICEKLSKSKNLITMESIRIGDIIVNVNAHVIYSHLEKYPKLSGYHFNKKGLNVYIYYNEKEDPVVGLVRLDFFKPYSDSKSLKKLKNFQVIQYRKNVKGIARGLPPTELPLYNLKELLSKTDAPVLIVEGEKTAEAAKQLFPDYVVTTTYGGADAPWRSDFTPLTGRNILISPDYDQPGTKYLNSVIELCKDVNAATIKMIPPTIFENYIILDGKVQKIYKFLKKGYDLVDALEDGWTHEFLKEFESHYLTCIINERKKDG